MKPEMLQTTLLEDLNRLACAEAQDQYGSDPRRAREALESLRWIDTTELGRYRREGWLARGELEVIERFLSFSQGRLASIPADSDPVAFTRSDPGWCSVRERALETLIALDGFVDIGIPGWGQQYRDEV